MVKLAWRTSKATKLSQLGVGTCAGMVACPGQCGIAQTQRVERWVSSLYVAKIEPAQPTRQLFQCG